MGVSWFSDGLSPSPTPLAMWAHARRCMRSDFGALVERINGQTENTKRFDYFD